MKSNLSVCWAFKYIIIVLAYHHKIAESFATDDVSSSVLAQAAE